MIDIMKKILAIILIIIFLISCSPSLYVNGTLMRKYNMSQNKYTPKKPYIKK
jgi:hypothetical protein